MLSYSKDGINWSTPVEVYVPQGTGSKASAPYICVTSDDRLVISFQTDEDSVAAGTGIGDRVSIMKTIISDGTPVDKLTKDNLKLQWLLWGTLDLPRLVFPWTKLED